MHSFGPCAIVPLKLSNGVESLLSELIKHALFVQMQSLMVGYLRCVLRTSSLFGNGPSMLWIAWPTNPPHIGLGSISMIGPNAYLSPTKTTWYLMWGVAFSTIWIASNDMVSPKPSSLLHNWTSRLGITCRNNARVAWKGTYWFVATLWLPKSNTWNALTRHGDLILGCCANVMEKQCFGMLLSRPLKVAQMLHS